MSKRNGRVTRTGVCVKYEAEIFSAVTRKIRKETGSFTAGSEAAYQAKEDAKKFLHGDDEMIVSVKITEIWERLYGMPDAYYYDNADILSEKRIK